MAGVALFIALVALIVGGLSFGCLIAIALYLRESHLRDEALRQHRRDQDR
jgi:hypothetical protein